MHFLARIPSQPDKTLLAGLQKNALQSKSKLHQSRGYRCHLLTAMSYVREVLFFGEDGVVSLLRKPAAIDFLEPSPTNNTVQNTVGTESKFPTSTRNRASCEFLALGRTKTTTTC